jgi:7-cyano-7-deazaguanine synthase
MIGRGKMSCLCCLSGGLDSSTVVFIISRKMPVHTIFFRYGQRTEDRELLCFEKISDDVKAVSRHIVDFSFYRDLNTSALVNSSMEIPEGDEDGIIPPTYVPFRNGVMLSVAAAYACSLGVNHIGIGAVWEDSSGYPDCRLEFIRAMEGAINLGLPDEDRLTVLAPVIDMKKSEIIRTGLSLGLDYSHTYSCYRDGEKPCLACPSCKLRMRAFFELGIKDSLLSL